MELKTFTADDILRLTKIKPWEKIGEPKSIWSYLNISLSSTQQEGVRFAPAVEMVTLKNPFTGKPYEDWRTKGGDWTTVFALTPEKSVVVTIEFKHGVEEIILGLPAGLVKPNEDKVEALRRELLEESGFAAKKITPLGDAERGFAASSRKSTARFFPFLGESLKLVKEQELDEEEEIEACLVPLAEWLKLVEFGLVRDASAVTTTYFALCELGFINTAF